MFPPVISIVATIFFQYQFVCLLFLLLQKESLSHSLELLLDSINNNTSTVTSSVTFHLFNDGVSWKLLENSEALGNAIFGTLSTTPVPADPDSAIEDDDAEQLTIASDTATTDSEETDIENTDNDIDASDNANEDNIDEESDESYYE